MIDILDNLQAVDGYVRIVLKTGEIIFGKPDCIVYDEDDEGFETIKRIRFEPWGEIHARYFHEADIGSFDEVNENDIPPTE